jgi:Tfp pilus assembly protein PilF
VVTELRGALLGEAGTARAKATATVQADVAAAVRSRGHDVEAHRLFLLGLHLLERVNEADTAKAIEYLKQSVDRDPDDALAWAELGRAYATQVDFGWEPLGEGIVRAREAIERALAINPEEAQAHSKRAWIRMHYERDWRGAEASFRRALELEPRNASALRSTGALAVCLDRPSEAIEFYLRALESDPLSTAAYNNLGYAYSLVGQRAEAEKALRQSLELAPGRIGTRAQLAFVLQQMGRPQEALDEALKEPEEVYRLWGLARIHHLEGRTAESRAALAALKERFSKECACQIAQIHALYGEADEAFEWLERAYRQRDGGLVSVKSTPDYRGLAGDPRWGRFLLKLGFES